MLTRLRPAFCRGLLMMTLFLVPAGFAVPQSASSPLARLNAGITLFGQGKWEEAVIELRRAQAEAPNKAIRGEALFWISLAELSAGEYEQALNDMDALAEADPESRRLGELAYHRGRVLYHLERYDEAVVCLKDYADSIQPADGAVLGEAESARKAAALYWMGECLFSLGQLEKAADVFGIITAEFPGSVKHEASVYRLALIDQKKIETELLSLLKWSHEEALRNMEEYRRKESSYDQAVSAYQKRITELQALLDGRREAAAVQEETNANYREQLMTAEEKIRGLENALAETSENLEKARDDAAAERLNNLKNSAVELESLIMEESR